MIKENLADNIKDVAIYLRKSRADGDIESTLENHKSTLIEVANLYGWTFEIYQEVKSGSSLAERDVMLKLLNDVDDNKFDAVLVFDHERITRGDSGDSEKIFWHLSNSNTKMVTASPFDIIDASNESDEDSLRMRSFFANWEYRQINRRMQHGKLKSREKENWIHGAAPFGYKYNRETKRLAVHPEEGEIMLRIIKEFCHLKLSASEIAWRLNKDKIKSRKNSVWNGNMLRSLLIKDIYLGNTTYNKSKGTPRKTKNKYSVKTPFKKLPKSEWIVKYNTHEALMTQEEYDYIHKHFGGTRSPKTDKEGNVFDLSGLCKTPDGRTYTKHKLLKDGSYTMIPRLKYNDEGKHEQEKFKSVRAELVRDAIVESTKALQKEIAKNLTTNDNSEELSLHRETLNKLEKEHENVLESYSRINIGFAEGLYSTDEAKEMKATMSQKQEDLETQIRQTRKKIDGLSNVKNEDRLERVQKFLDDIKEAKDGKELNILYKSIIDYIEVDYQELRHCSISVNFL